MQRNKRHSYGIIPVWKDSAGFSFLVVNQAERDKGPNEIHNHWTFTKGTPEENENALVTAKRETHEEIGVCIENIVEEPSFTVAYSFHEGGEEINKQVTYFIGYPETSEFTVDGVEILEGVWLSYEEARNKLIYDVSKELLDEVMEFLTHLDK